MLNTYLITFDCPLSKTYWLKMNCRWIYQWHTVVDLGYCFYGGRQWIKSCFVTYKLYITTIKKKKKQLYINTWFCNLSGTTATVLKKCLHNIYPSRLVGFCSFNNFNRYLLFLYFDNIIIIYIFNKFTQICPLTYQLLLFYNNDVSES